MTSPEFPTVQDDNWYLRTVRPLSDKCLSAIEANCPEVGNIKSLVDEEITRATREIREAKGHALEMQ